MFAVCGIEATVQAFEEPLSLVCPGVFIQVTLSHVNNFTDFTGMHSIYCVFRLVSLTLK